MTVRKGRAFPIAAGVVLAAILAAVGAAALQVAVKPVKTFERPDGRKNRTRGAARKGSAPFLRYAFYPAGTLIMTGPEKGARSTGG